jgi:hypothetical protein
VLQFWIFDNGIYKAWHAWHKSWNKEETLFRLLIGTTFLQIFFNPDCYRCAGDVDYLTLVVHLDFVSACLRSRHIFVSQSWCAAVVGTLNTSSTRFQKSKLFYICRCAMHRWAASVIADTFVVCCVHCRQIEMCASCDLGVLPIIFIIQLTWFQNRTPHPSWTDRWPCSHDYCDEWSTPQLGVAQHRAYI